MLKQAQRLRLQKAFCRFYKSTSEARQFLGVAEHDSVKLIQTKVSIWSKKVTFTGAIQMPRCNNRATIANLQGLRILAGTRVMLFFFMIFFSAGVEHLATEKKFNSKEQYETEVKTIAQKDSRNMIFFGTVLLLGGMLQVAVVAKS